MNDPECQEEWRPIVGYGGFYEISNLGQVKALVRPAKNACNYVRIMRQSTDKHGYYRVLLRPGDGQDGKSRLVSRLVAAAFVPNPLNHPVVNHIDGVKKNNLPSNLEWCSIKENTQHAWNMGLCVANSRLRVNEVILIRHLHESGCPKGVLAKQYGMSPVTIDDIIRRRTWKLV